MPLVPAAPAAGPPVEFTPPGATAVSLSASRPSVPLGPVPVGIHGLGDRATAAVAAIAGAAPDRLATAAAAGGDHCRGPAGRAGRAEADGAGATATAGAAVGRAGEQAVAEDAQEEARVARATGAARRPAGAAGAGRRARAGGAGAAGLGRHLLARVDPVGDGLPGGRAAGAARARWAAGLATGGAGAAGGDDGHRVGPGRGDGGLELATGGGLPGADRRGAGLAVQEWREGQGAREREQYDEQRHNRLAVQGESSVMNRDA